ncbi:MAG: hypothetical protein CM15mP1_0960 [Methanobacteriota archaeon]|nr:MAG: hypothetical protein CM15mP1_0960 [Euryarchaeota archaeon]
MGRKSITQNLPEWCREQVNLTRDTRAQQWVVPNFKPDKVYLLALYQCHLWRWGFNGSFEISTFIAAFVQAGTGFPLAQCRTQFPVTIETQVQIGNYSYFGSVTENVYRSAGEAHNLSTQVEIANISAKRNDVISYSMTATTSCPYSINLEWGGSGEYAGGIVIVGDLFSPVVGGNCG